MKYFLIVCAFIFHHGLISPTDSMPVKEKSCIQMSPEKEKEINTLLEEVTDSLNDIASKHDNIDITVLKIGIESHSEDESEEKETKLQVLVKDCQDNEGDSKDNEESGVVVNKCVDNSKGTTFNNKEPGEHETVAENGDLNTSQKKNDGKALQESSSGMKEPISNENEKEIERNKDLNDVPTGAIEKYTAIDNIDLDKAVSNKVIEKPNMGDDIGNVLVKNDDQPQIIKISDTTNVDVNKEFKINPIPDISNNRNMQVNDGRSSLSNAEDKEVPSIHAKRRRIEGPSKAFGDKNDGKSICRESEGCDNYRPEIMVLHLSKKSERLLNILKKTRNMDPLFVYVEERRGHKKYVFL